MSDSETSFMETSNIDATPVSISESDCSESSKTPEGDGGHSAEESLVHRPNRRGRLIVSDSDEDESSEESEQIDEKELERTERLVDRLTMSPRTRRSITAVRRDSSSDESDEVEEEVTPRAEKRREPDSSGSDAEESGHESEKEEDVPSNMNETVEMANVSLALGNLTVDMNEIESSEEEEEQKVVQEERKPSIANVSKGSFEKSIQEKHSSTQAEVIDLISDDEDSARTISPAKPAIFLQPTIKSATTKSQSLIETERAKLEQLKSNLAKAQLLFQSKWHELPDKGKGILARQAILKQEIAQVEALLSSVTDTKGAKSLKANLSDDVQVISPPLQPKNVFTSTKIGQTPPTEPKAPLGPSLTWNDVAAVGDAVKPQYTGKQGMKTFENQRKLTHARLENLFGALNKRPSEDTLAEQPTSLNTALMPHQRHGLAWMKWREQQKPRGGILADDMGLGKTLSMVALMLTNNGEDESDDENANDSDDDVSVVSDKWSAKGRRTNYPGGTLVVCPASLIEQWKGEVDRRVARGALTVILHHGTKREKAKYLSRYDLVITTYGVVSSEHKSNGDLFHIKWFRVILDEAHVIRNHKTGFSISTTDLRAKCRWALTGTPIHNHTKDIYAFFRFLRCTPFNDLHTYKRFIEDRASGGETRLHALIQSLMLRRTKAQLQAVSDFSLPDKSSVQVAVALQTDEMNVYQKVMQFSKNTFMKYLKQRQEREGGFVRRPQQQWPTGADVQAEKRELEAIVQRFTVASGTEVKAHTILVLLLRLRQICAHPGLINEMIRDDELDDSDSAAAPTNNNQIDLLQELDKLNVGDSDAVIEKIEKASARLLTRSNPVFNMDRISSKIAAVLDHYERVVQPRGEKAVFCSQWAVVLNLYAQHLRARGNRICMLTGAVPVRERNDIVEGFNRPDRGPRVMLLSLTAGGVGLNLAGANHMYVLDPHWNPQLEAQAQDRIYRVGQKKPVFLYRFVCSQTIEEDIVKIQEKKLAIAESVLTGAKSKGSKLTLDDMKTLFGV